MKTIALVACLPLMLAAAAPQPMPIDLQVESPAVVQAQLDRLAAVLEQYHPDLKDAARRTRFEADVQRLKDSVQDPIPTWQAWSLQAELFRSLDDPHTALYPQVLEDRTLAVNINWVSDGILISPSSWAPKALFPDNSELLRLGTYDPAELLKRLAALHAGTVLWLKASPAHVVRFDYELRWLSALDSAGNVPVTIRTPQGEIRQLTLEPMPLPTDIKNDTKQKPPWFRWELDKAHDIGWFTLDQMNLTADYERSVQGFFHAVEAAGITRVAVDLRKDGGGSSLTALPFMQYLGVKSYKDYSDVISLDPHALETVMAEFQAEMKAAYPDHYETDLSTPAIAAGDSVFHGEFYLVTGPGCFSSAMEFAADVKFNHVGKIIGQPCGEVVTGPGEVKFFPHPDSSVPFQVSTKIWTWPGLPAGSLVTPDIEVPVTVKDVQQGIDSARVWLERSATHAPAASTGVQ